MMTTEQQADSRLRTIQGMMTNAVPNNGGSIEHACAAITAIITPAVCGGMFALPAPAASRVTAALYECEEGSDDLRAIQGGGGPSERLYKIIRGTRRRIDAYCRAHYNRYGDTLLVRFRP